jgi:nicotinamidase-related amidase
VPATVLDAETALVVIDLQRGMAQRPWLHPFQRVVANAARLARAFREAGRPVAFVTVVASLADETPRHSRTDIAPRALALDPSDYELVPELAREQADISIERRGLCPFTGTSLELELRRRGVTGIVLTGVATSLAVESAARTAHERAFNVTFAWDAMTDLDDVAQDASLTNIFPRFGEVDSTDAILALLRPMK